MPVTVTTYHLEMKDSRALRPKVVPAKDLELKQARVPSPELNRFLYCAVGGDWHWIDRLSWTHERWLGYLARPQLETWVLYVSGTPAGYFELEAQPGKSVEIAYFGLLPQFLGRGLGGWLLTAATRRAWEMGAARVWVHTCTLDHPGALANYQARGFQLFKEETEKKDFPERSPGPWPGAERRAVPTGQPRRS